MDRFIQFLQEVRVELSRVSWPSKNQLVQYTIAVLGISLFLAVFLGALDAGFSFAVDRLILGRF